MVDATTPPGPAGGTSTSPGKADRASASPGKSGPASPVSTGLPEEALVADENIAEDESLESDDLASSSASLASSVLKYRHENGRRYHAFKDGAYAFPNDDAEAERMDFQHVMHTLTHDGKLFLAPIDQGEASHVLDAGTGTGIWAIDFADDNPQAKVIGVDLSPIQPVFVPPNAEFYIADLEESWTFSNPFDLIHTRLLTGSIADWPKFYKQSFDHLAPGGFIELSDPAMTIRSDDDTLPKDSALYEWTKLMTDAAVKLGRPPSTAETTASQLAEAGFINIEQRHFKWPTNSWPKDPKMKQLGAMTFEDIGKNLYGLSVALFTRGLGWTIEELQVFLVQVRREMRDPKIHAYIPVYVVYGQKPAET
ncbi:related to methyltransferase [Cephalotrichum gorgonifer]|uniref:Related to methyltransferase n=1 Tax=Cephalotrichum gorgonifer TaxID=2041049 RepID=A0AAE8N368_9PEZI|nr:related to methyltransferase [Cephalotrichum gorgonifer]